MLKPARSAPVVVRLADLDVLHRPAITRAPGMAGAAAPLAQPTADSDADDEAAPRRRSHHPGPPRDVPRLPAGVVLTLPVRFHGTGGAYARLWWRHLGLLLLTAGLAWPWTVARSRRHFLQQIEVAGERLDDPRTGLALAPRLWLAMGLWAGTAVAAAQSLWAGLAMLTLVLALTPWWQHAGLLQQWAGVTWAGRRLWFDGSRHDAFAAGTPTALLTAAALCAAVLGVERGQPWGWVAGGLALVWLAHVPWALTAHWRYRQQHIRLGPLRLRWKGTTASVLEALLRIMALAMVCALVYGACIAAARMLWGAWRDQPWPVPLALHLVPLAILYLTVVRPSAQARLTALVWNSSGNRHLRLRMRLNVADHVRLHLKNAGLLMVTAGLYWPWAVVAVRRLQWADVVIHSRVDPVTLRAFWPAAVGANPPAPASPPADWPARAPGDEARACPAGARLRTMAG